MKGLTVTSPAFENNQPIPQKYGAYYQDVNPPIQIMGIPEGTVSLALIVDDPDAPHGTFDHWVIWNISPSQSLIAEGSAPGVEGLNSMSEKGYTGPAPPPGKPHHYHFKVYALDTKLNMSVNSAKRDLENAMQGHILARGSLIGLFQTART